MTQPQVSKLSTADIEYMQPDFLVIYSSPKGAVVASATILHLSGYYIPKKPRLAIYSYIHLAYYTFTIEPAGV